MRQQQMTHENFIHAVRAIAVTRLQNADERRVVEETKLIYGIGETGLRGVTHYDCWKNGHTHHLAEICAFGEDSWVQVAGTTLHELAHTITRGAGHGKPWAEACERLGLRFVRAAGTKYSLACFAPDVRDGLARINKPEDGQPQASRGRFIIPGQAPKVRPCSAGIGTKGGKSRGIGSGSRLRKYTCDCGQIIRASTDDLAAVHSPCGSTFKRA